MMLNRNTMPATQAKVILAKRRREAKRKEIQDNILHGFCDKPECIFARDSRCLRARITECKGYKGYSDLAGTLNTLKIATLEGKIGSWSRSMVKNLLKDE